MASMEQDEEQLSATSTTAEANSPALQMQRLKMEGMIGAHFNSMRCPRSPVDDSLWISHHLTYLACIKRMLWIQGRDAFRRFIAQRREDQGAGVTVFLRSFGLSICVRMERESTVVVFERNEDHDGDCWNSSWKVYSNGRERLVS